VPTPGGRKNFLFRLNFSPASSGNFKSGVGLAAFFRQPGFQKEPTV
jgi:hypothetical protein